MRFGWILLVVVLSVCSVSGQDTCDVLSQPNLMSSVGLCADLSIGEVCALADGVALKNESLLQTLLADERTNLTDINEITLEQDRQQQWGIGRLKLAAYAENSWNLVPVEVLAFGDANIRNMATPTDLQDVIVTAAEGVNIRRTPSEDATVLGAAAQDQVIKAVARLDDSSWLQIVTPEGVIGWVRTDAFLDDISLLPVVSSDNPIVVDTALNFTRLQSTLVSFECMTSNIRGGLLLQTPKDAPIANLNINGADLALSGSVWVQAIALESGTATAIYALENGVEVNVPQGQVEIAEGQFAVFFGSLLEESSEVTGELPTPTSFDGIELAQLPVYLLNEPFYIPIDITRVLQPRPDGDFSPLDGMLATAPCRITTGEGGSNIRAGAGREYPIQAVMGYRESADVLGRAMGSDGQNWWNIGPYLWVSGQTTVTGGDCAVVAEMVVEQVR